MATKGREVADQIGAMIADILGWLICLSLVVGIYELGYWLAPHFGGAGHRDTFGILGVVTTIWMYEHQVAHHRWAMLQERH